jgi:hypothetical protein
MATLELTEKQKELGVRALEDGETSLRRKCGINGCESNYLALYDPDWCLAQCRMCGEVFQIRGRGREQHDHYRNPYTMGRSLTLP